MRSFVHASVTVCIKQSPLSITRQNFPGLAHQREREPSLQTALKKTGRALLLGALRLAQVGLSVSFTNLGEVAALRGHPTRSLTDMCFCKQCFA